jgi:hypothetical protein
MRRFITPFARANALRMKRSLFCGVFLVVEGMDDKHTFDNLIDHDTCELVIADGKENALILTRILNGGGDRGLLTVVDADFDRLLQSAPPETNILLTDSHDLECMILASPALDHVLLEFGNEERIGAFERSTGGLVRTLLFRKAVPLGCLRMISVRDDLNFDFDGIGFSKFVSNLSLECDISEMVRTVVNKSQAHSVSLGEVGTLVEEELRRGHAASQIVCGHDVIELLAIGLRSIFARRAVHEVSADVLHRSLRLAYRMEDFLETVLSDHIHIWERANAPYRVLRERI